jgi:HSP20 family molecular chaperone IbpA
MNSKEKNGTQQHPQTGEAEVLKKGKVNTPDVDIFVNDEEILVVADIPGICKKDLSIHIENDTLTLEAAFAAKFEGTPQRQEFTASDYRRIFTLPKGLDVEKSKAELKQGVLYLHLPKSSAVKACRIEVKAE